jgi:hypothetical protein
MASCTVISHVDPLSPTAGVLIGTYDTEKDSCQAAKDHFQSPAETWDRCQIYAEKTVHDCKGQGIDLQ